MNKLGVLTLACMLSVSWEAEAQLGPPPATGQLPRAQPVPLSGQPQNGTVVPSEAAAPGGGANSLDLAAEQDYITALFAYNLARVSLARAVGQTEQGIALLLDGLAGGR